MKFWKKKTKEVKNKNLRVIFPFYVCAAGVMVVNFCRITGKSELEET